MLWLRPTLSLLLACIQLVMGQEVVHQVTNGTGLYCRGCSVIVEAVHDHIMATRDRWGEPGFKIRTKGYLEQCEPPHKACK